MCFVFCCFFWCFFVYVLEKCCVFVSVCWCCWVFDGICFCFFVGSFEGVSLFFLFTGAQKDLNKGFLSFLLLWFTRRLATEEICRSVI